MFKNIILFLIFLKFSQSFAAEKEKKIRDGKHLSLAENKLFFALSDFTSYLTETLADFNDKNLGSSEWGKVLGYEEMKPNLPSQEARGIKKLSMSMLPLVFHVGATSTWMLITSIMAAKSVAIGLLLLVFKIAVSSAKVASFFTLLKSKNSEHHPTYTWSTHGHERSFSNKAIPIHEEWSTYNPEWASEIHSTGYKTIPEYKENTLSTHYEELESIEPVKADKKYG